MHEGDDEIGARVRGRGRTRRCGRGKRDNEVMAIEVRKNEVRGIEVRASEVRAIEGRSR